MKKNRKARLNLNQENVAAVNVREPALDIEELSLHGRPLPLPPNQERAVRSRGPIPTVPNIAYNSYDYPRMAQSEGWNL